MLRHKWIARLVAAVLIVSNALVYQAQPPPVLAADPEPELPPVTLPEKGKNPKLDSRLNRLLEQQSDNSSPRRAQPNPDKIGTDSVRVIIETSANQTGLVRQAAAALGVVEASDGNLLQVNVPAGQLAALADLPGVRFVRTPYRFVEDVISEGVAVIGADVWQNASYNGSGVKVGIVDAGFSGYTTRQAEGELPASITIWPPKVGDVGTSIHGTAVAEIVYDVAPGAQFYLANVGSEVELGNAVDWMITQGVHVISMSLGWYPGGPGDGTGPIAVVVNRARAAGILWVNSAGNSAQEHWQGNFIDTDGNTWHEFRQTSPIDETQSIYVQAGAPIIVFLKWDDPWGSSSNDYDLYLTDNQSIIRASSLDRQDGNDNPTEELQFIGAYTGFYRIWIKKVGNPATVNMHLYSLYQTLEYQVAAGSITIPADSPNAMAVGAVRWNESTIRYFSSQGPTTDNRTKPDIVAPDGVSTRAYSPGTFSGTSASAPHTAGSAVLVKQAFPSYNATQIQAFLEGRAVDLGAAGKDNVFGSGRLSLGLLAPSVVTNNATNVTNNSTSLSGNLTSLGTASSVNVTFQYGTTSGNLTIETEIVAMSLTGSFSANLSALSANTTYYFRARASGQGDGFGDEKSFTTSAAPVVSSDNATNITYNSARLNGILSSLGSVSSTNVSFEYGMESANYTASTTVQTMNSTGTFSANISALSANTTYYFRAKAVGDGTSHGSEKTFTTLPTTPVVTTGDAANITYYSAVLSGNLTSLGTASSVNVTFQWGTASGNYTAETIVQSVNVTGGFYFNLGSLSDNMTFYYRAKADGHGTSYGAEKSFTTLSTVPPSAVKVMTRNLYFGADLAPVIASPTQANVEATFTRVQTTNFTARAEFLADEIMARQPDLIGLQEAVLWRTQTPGDILSGNGTPNATVIAYDFVQILLDKLAARGLTYTAVATHTGFDVELPGIGRDIRLTDRDVILARTGRLTLSNAQTGHFTANGVLTLPAPVGNVTVLRGWGSVDASTSNGTFRFINTHLESFFSLFPGINQQQGAEIIGGPANTILPVVLVGDFNSAAAGTGFATPTYGNIIAAGFSDAWSIANPTISGYTWGHTELLDNASSNLTARIDLILLRGPFSVIDASITGDTPLAITGTVKWPSDHAGVATTLDFNPTPPSATTENATDIGPFSAKLKGNLTSLGTASSVNVSFQWGTASGNYTGEISSYYTSMNSTGPFSGNLSGLSPATTYYYRAKAVGHGTAYGEERSFTTDSTPPTVVTQNATNVGFFSVGISGNLTDLGTASSVNVTLQWGTQSGNLTIETEIIAMSLTGTYSANLSGLSSNTTYYYRAKARGHGLVYGNEKSFTTLTTTPPTVVTDNVTSVSYFSSALSGNLTSLGTASTVNATFQWGPNSGNYTAETAVQSTNMTGAFSANLSGLSSNTTYYYRAKVLGYTTGLDAGIHGTAYGSERTFTTLATTSPDVTTLGSANVSYFSATLSGNLTEMGTASTVNVTLRWGITSGNYTAETAVQSTNVTGVFSANLTGLSANTTYYFRAKAVGYSTGLDAGLHGADSGAELSFATLATALPAVNTIGATSVTASSARLSGNLTSLGTASTANVSFQLGTGAGNYVAESSVQTVSANGTFEIDVTGLSASTTYYFRAKVAGHGAAYGVEKTFTTSAQPTFGGGGGGGGSGGGTGIMPVSLSGLGGIGPLINGLTGVTLNSATLVTIDGKVSIVIAANTTMLGSNQLAVTGLSATVAAPPSAPPPGAVIILNYEFGPDGATFSPPLPITVSYTEDQLPSGSSESNLYLAFWNGSQWVVVPSAVDPVSNTVTGQVAHFTSIALIVAPPAPPVLPPPAPPTTRVEPVPPPAPAPAPAPPAPSAPAPAPAPAPAASPAPAVEQAAPQPPPAPTPSPAPILGGVSYLWWIAGAGALLVAGAVLLVVQRRRRSNLK